MLHNKGLGDVIGVMQMRVAVALVAALKGGSGA
jgi:hypothetical protein